jgi:hypothetical protein
LVTHGSRAGTGGTETCPYGRIQVGGHFAGETFPHGRIGPNEIPLYRRAVEGVRNTTAASFSTRSKVTDLGRAAS